MVSRITKYKGTPVVTMRERKNTGVRLTFGVRKANLIVRNMDMIKSFTETYIANGSLVRKRPAIQLPSSFAEVRRTVYSYCRKNGNKTSKFVAKRFKIKVMQAAAVKAWITMGK